MDLVSEAWDSEFFGFPIYSVRGRPEPLTLPRRARELGIRCAYYFCPAAHEEGIAAAEDLGFGLVDIRIILHATPSELSQGESTSAAVDVETARAADLPELREVAAELSTYSRFASDPRFGPAQARRLYDRWIDVSFEGRASPFLVARDGPRVLGLVTCRREGEQARLELVGVRRSATGLGIGSTLVAQARRSLEDNGCRTISVTTQARNDRAMAFYQRCGFRVAEVSLVYHRWFEDTNK